MPADVVHFRPGVSLANVKSGNPVVGDIEWQQFAALANWTNGHGGMLIPWTQLPGEMDDNAVTFHFYIAPKARAVERVWVVSLRSGGSPVTIEAGSADPVTVQPSEAASSGQVFVIRESLSAKTAAAAGTSITFGVPEAGSAYCYGLCMYEQDRSRLTLDTTDYGVDQATLKTRQPIFDASNKSVAGVCDAYVNLDARRAGFFHWSSNLAGVDSDLEVTQASYTDLFPLHVPILGAIVNSGEVTTTVTCAAYAKVNSGTGNIKFLSDQAGANVVINVTATDFAWVTGSLTIDAEDFNSDGRRDSVWEAVQIQAQKGTATTLTIGALSIVRTTTPV